MSSERSIAPPQINGVVGAVLRCVAGLMLAALLMLAGTGCGILGAIAYKASPPPTVTAQYVPPHEPMVVFVQRSDNPAGAAFESERIGRLVTDDLRAHGIGPMVDPAGLVGLSGSRNGEAAWVAELNAARAQTGPATHPQTVAEVGRAVGAAQVLYVDLVDFDIQPALATEMIKGQADARVRVIDTETGQTRWPLDMTQGRPVSVGTPYVQPGIKLDDATVRAQMCTDLATQVARLFYTWQADQVDSGSVQH